MRWFNQGRPRGRSLATSLAFMASAATAADYRDWIDTADVYLNTSAGGANVATTMLGFPILVRLDGTSFAFAKAKGAGQDIRFSNMSGTPLPHQIERWDSAGAKAEIWVLADTVKANSSTHRVRMYWNNPAAADESNGGAVFPASKGLISVFHMGGVGTADRPNAVTGGAAAAPNNYDGDEARPGVVGLSDSLDGAAPGDWLNLGAGYSDFSGGFTYSAWVYPSAVKKWSHILDLGNPIGTDLKGKDNICIGREDLTNHLITHLYLQNAAHSPLRSDGYIANNAWQFITIAITNTDSTVRWYKNGSLVEAKKMLAPLSNAVRANNWMGRSPWTADEYFQGKLDEVRISKLAHSAAWIKLSYENQKPDQNMVTLKPPPKCQSAFAPPADITVKEGDGVTLTARADCAVSFDWTPVSGPTPRILDPNVKALQFPAPRVKGDTSIVFRFTANFGDSTRTKDVRVTVQETIPEPAFNLSAAVVWSGQDSIRVTATVTNMAAVKASRDSIITWAWSLTGLAADTAWRNGALVLRNPAGNGKGQVTLCLSNNATPVCRSTDVTVQNPTGILRLPAAQGAVTAREARRSVDGRWLPEWSRIRLAFPAKPARN